MTDDHNARTAFVAALTAAITDGSFVRLTIGGYRGADETLQKITVKPILIKGAEKLSFTFRHKTRDIVKNYVPADALSRIEVALTNDFGNAMLFTTTGDIQFERNKKGKETLRHHKPTETAAPAMAHDRAKTRHVETAGKPYLTDLRITDKNGAIIPAAQDKYKQIDKYVEILSGLVKNLPGNKNLSIVDMGAGKGYLTFALYDFIVNTMNRPATVTGIEYRNDLVDLCNDIAARAHFKDLHFKQGTIEDTDCTGANIVIALHACDTATDDALKKGIAAEADLIVVAPCCHKQVRREIESHKRENDLAALMKHGIFTERVAEMTTDALRGLVLEYCGYSVKIFEFISDAHTPKNVMIVATKTKRTPTDKQAIAEKISALTTYFGIEQQPLLPLIS